MFFATKNLTEQAVTPCVPWDFKPAKVISKQIRESKQDRQEWYQNTGTAHQFYTGLEGINSNMRVSKENPPYKMHSFSADYDLPIPDQRVDEGIKLMQHKPAWVERSLGGNVRLVWLLDSPILVADMEFCSVLLDTFVDKLGMDMLPGLDRPAFTTPTRLLANGCAWRNTGHGKVNLQAFLVAAGQKHRFSGEGEATIPLDIVEAELKKKYKDFNWPSEFVVGSQGPSFWIAGSASPLSAIVKAEGMITFSAHATKVFYPWADILGADFVKAFKEDSVASATKDVYFDGKNYWRIINGKYVSNERTELILHWKADCRISAKPEKSGISPIENCLNHVHHNGRIKNAAPFVLQRSGIVTFMGEQRLNTACCKPFEPATGSQKFGPWGNFPFYSALLTHNLDPIEYQLQHYISWVHYFYSAAYNYEPLPGHNSIMVGAPGTGKTLLSRIVNGTLVGGFIDASSFLVDGGAFNAHLLEYPLWCLDDDSPSSSANAQSRFQNMIKKSVANVETIHNQKFEKAGAAAWCGRIAMTFNADITSFRNIGPMDNSSRDKTNLYRGAQFPTFDFPSRPETLKLLMAEMPYIARFFLDWKIPDEVRTRDKRYGFESYQNPSLFVRANQSSNSAPFKEVLIEVMKAWFLQNREAVFWLGTISALSLLIRTTGYDIVTSSMRVESMNRYLEQVVKEGTLKIEVSDGPHETRQFKIPRSTILPPL